MVNSIWRIVRDWENWELVVTRSMTILCVRLRMLTVWKWLKWTVLCIITLPLSGKATLSWEVCITVLWWWLDMPKLKSLAFAGVFKECSRVVFESEWHEAGIMTRLAWVDFHSTRLWCIPIQRWWIIGVHYAGLNSSSDLMNRLAQTRDHHS